MPIKNLSDQVRLPRLGKIRLGIKVESERGPYPKATDYLVCPREVQEVFGERPTQISIMFPTDDLPQQWLKRYSLTQGLVCKGDGETAWRKVDSATAGFAGRDTREWHMADMECDPQECAEYKERRCRRVLSLQFCLPDCPGLGVYQIDSTSRNSILNVNNSIRLVQAISGGRLRWIPLTLTLEPIQVSPQGVTTKQVYVLNIRTDVKLADVARAAQLPAGRVLIDEPEEAEPPSDLFPPEILAELEREALAEDGGEGVAEMVSPKADAALGVRLLPIPKETKEEPPKSTGKGKPPKAAPPKAEPPLKVDDPLDPLRRELVALVTGAAPIGMGLGKEQAKEWLVKNFPGKVSTKELNEEELKQAIALAKKTVAAVQDAELDLEEEF